MNMEPELCVLFQKYADVNLTDAVYLTLKEGVTKGFLTGGTKLSELELASVFKVSRTPIQKALVRLECDGLVVNEPKRGYMVTKMGYAECIDCNEFYLALYTAAAITVMSHGIDRYYDTQLSRRLEEMETVTDLEQFLLMDDEFHFQIACSTKNQEMISAFQRIMAKGCVMGLFEGVHPPVDEARFLSEHKQLNRQLFDILRSGRVEELVAFMENRHNPHMRNLVNQWIYSKA